MEGVDSELNFNWCSSNFALCVSAEHSLRKSLTGKPVTSVHQLMDRIDKYKRVKEDQ